jgi:hypothetical protein
MFDSPIQNSRATHPLPSITQSLALLCIELLSSELAFTQPELDRVLLAETWRDEMADRIKDFGGIIERQYQNLLFVAFSQEHTPIDKLENALVFTRSLYENPLSILQGIPALKLRFGLALEDAQHRNPMGASTERSLAEAHQIIVSDTVVQALGQKRYPFIPLSGESPIARKGSYYVLHMQDIGSAHSGPQFDLEASPYVSTGTHATPAAETPEFLSAPASIGGDNTSEEDGFTAFLHEEAGGLHVPQEVAAVEDTALSVAPTEPTPPSNLPPFEELPDAYANAAASIESHTTEEAFSDTSPTIETGVSQSPLSVLSMAAVTAPALLVGKSQNRPTPTLSEPNAFQSSGWHETLAHSLELTASTEITHPPSQTFASPLDLPAAKIYNARLHLFDTPPEWPDVPQLDLWQSSSASTLMAQTQYHGFQGIVESLLEQAAKRLQGAEDAPPGIFVLEAESGTGSTTAFNMARQHLETVFNDATPHSDNETAQEAPFLCLTSGPYAHNAAIPFPLEVWHHVCRNLFQLPTEGHTTDSIRPTVEQLLFYITPEEHHAAIHPYINTLVRFMGGETATEQEPYADLVETLAWTFSQLSTVKPIVFQLENLHTADEASLYVLQVLWSQHLLHERPGLTWWIHYAPGVHLAIFEQDFLPHLQLKRLTPLSEPEAQQFISQGLLSSLNPSDLPAAFVNGLVQLGQGRPFYLEEGIRFAIEQGVFTQDEETGQLSVTDQTAIQQFQWPATLADLWQHRLTFLPEEVAKVLQLAGILGFRFSMSTLTSLLGTEEETIQQFLGFLWQHGWLVPDGADCVSFRHADLLNALRGFMPQDDLQHMHAWVLEAFSQSFEPPIVVPEPLLALHAFYAPEPTQVEAACQRWQERLLPFCNEWLGSLQQITMLQKPTMPLEERILHLRHYYAFMGDDAAERQLARCEAYAAFQEGSIFLPPEQAFESLLILGEEARHQVQLEKAITIFQSASELAQAFQDGAARTEALFIASTSLLHLAWLTFDVTQIAFLWGNLEHHPAWDDDTHETLLPWKLEALNVGFKLMTFQARSADIKNWYQKAQALWQVCIQSETNPLWIARSQLAYGFYLHTKGAYPGYQQIMDYVKQVLSRTPEGTPLLHDTLVDFIQLQWQEDRFAIHSHEVQQRYSYLKEDLAVRGGHFSLLHRMILETRCEAVLSPATLLQQAEAFEKHRLRIYAQELYSHAIWQALLMRQAYAAEQALAKWTALNPQDAVATHAPVLHWLVQLLQARIYILQKQYKPAANCLQQQWEAVAQSLLGRPLILYLSLLAHIYHCLAHSPRLHESTAHQYKEKSRMFAQKAIYLARQGQHPALEDSSKKLMQYG